MWRFYKIKFAENLKILLNPKFESVMLVEKFSTLTEGVITDELM